jgi:hypothetical protein
MLSVVSHPNALIRYAAGAAAVGSFAVGGWVGLLGLATVAGCSFLLCLSFHGDRGERIWLTMTLAIWTVVAVWAWSGTTECPPEAPNHCAVGR